VNKHTIFFDTSAHLKGLGERFALYCFVFATGLDDDKYDFATSQASIVEEKGLTEGQQIEICP